MAGLGQGTPTTPEVTSVSYKVVGASRIPVSKQYGSVWKSRRDAAAKKRDDSQLTAAWNEAVRYFNNDQLVSGRTASGSGLPPRGLAGRVIVEYAEVENIVFANTNSAVSAVYAKNPAISTTAENPALEDMATVSQELVNVLFAKLEAPGVNLKPKMQRALVNTFLCNLGWVRVGWTAKEDSTEQAMTDLAMLAKELEKPDLTQKEIETVEGKLRAIDEQYAVLTEAGPFVKWLPPTAVLRDTSSVEEDLSDAYWLIEEDYIPTSYLRAKYMQDGTDKSIYEPTHFLPVGSSKNNVESLTEELNNFTLLDKGADYGQLGFDSQAAFDSSKVTKVWRVWDKVTRRVFLYHDKTWTWPIWVWDDPLKLSTFFPFIPLHFYCSPTGGESKGEVSYYLDQQDAINFCNSVVHSVRGWAGTKVGFDPSVLDQKTANSILFSKTLQAIPITPPEGKSISDVMPHGIEHPAAKQLALFDKGPIYQSIDRMSVINEVQRGGQFKTNTTNQAIEQYSQVSQSRFDAIIDGVEDAVGHVGYLLLQLCWRYMDQQTVAMLLGDEDAAQWRNLDDREIRQMSVRVEGGSTQKPNSSGKKKEAITLGQILGQFAGASPVAVILAVKALARAFSDSIDIDDEEWKQLLDSLMQKAMAPEPPPGGEPAPNGAGSGGIPPEAQAAAQEMVSRGVPPQVAMQKVSQALNGGGASEH